ncbi:hypothetical protein [Mesoflavibacter zeaxanthinifaciens]|uniref:hypothetical protein n=1 Tax=Mesoflavibacter zeaxanthinifaciens TaxID=393060 RepID=UPI003A90EDC6
MFSQVTQDTLGVNNIYAPKIFYDSFSVEESWEIHKSAYVKQLRADGLTDKEIKRNMVVYEKNKNKFIAEIKEQQRIAIIQRKRAAEQRALADVERRKAAKERRLAAIQRERAEELRSLADIERKKAAEQRGRNEILRARAEALRREADIQRAKADEQRKLAEIQRLKFEKERVKCQEWRENSENILIKNLTLTKQIHNIKPMIFNITSKTTLYIGIRAHINSGTILMEIYNPQGIKEVELYLEHKAGFNSVTHSGFSKATSGALDKTIPYAEVGEWQIKITPEKTDGTIAMSVAHHIKSAMNE